MPLLFATGLKLVGYIGVPVVVVMGLLIWSLRRQLDPMVLDRKREKEAKARRRAQRRQ